MQIKDQVIIIVDYSPYKNYTNELINVFNKDYRIIYESPNERNIHDIYAKYNTVENLHIISIRGTNETFGNLQLTNSSHMMYQCIIDDNHYLTLTRTELTSMHSIEIEKILIAVLNHRLPECNPSFNII